MPPNISENEGGQLLNSLLCDLTPLNQISFHLFSLFIHKKNDLKMNRRQLFSSSKRDVENNKGQQNKFEVLTCNVLSEGCKKHLVVINECYIEANKYHLEKDYLNTIESLKNAFFRTNQLDDNSCLKCANLFRSTITESIENIHGELQNLTTGLFRKKRYERSFIVSREVLNEIKRG